MNRRVRHRAEELVNHHPRALVTDAGSVEGETVDIGDPSRAVPDKHNRDLALYRDAVKKVAGVRSAWFVDLYAPTLSARDYGINPLTDNGIHLNAYGYSRLADAVEAGLGWEPQKRIEMTRGPRFEQAEGRRPGFEETMYLLDLALDPKVVDLPSKEVPWSRFEESLKARRLE